MKKRIKQQQTTRTTKTTKTKLKLERETVRVLQGTNQNSLVDIAVNTSNEDGRASCGPNCRPAGFAPRRKGNAS
jgi:hypothetical protein